MARLFVRGVDAARKRKRSPAAPMEKGAYFPMATGIW